jgi:hypothetical protein
MWLAFRPKGGRRPEIGIWDVEQHIAVAHMERVGC